VIVYCKTILFVNMHKIY